MDQTTDQSWWKLHVRVARGEALSQDERRIYEAKLKHLDAEEKQQWTETDMTMLRQLKSEVESLQNTSAELQAKSDALDRRIWTLEGVYMALMGLDLSSQDHAPSPF